jgi:hypothetical protein
MTRSRNNSLRLIAAPLAALFVLTLCPRLGAQELGFWDLTSAAPRDRTRQPRSGRGSGGGVGGGNGGSLKPAGPVRLTLLYVDATLARGEREITYEVEIENVGDKVIEVPLDPNLADMEPPDPKLSYEYISGGPGLDLADAAGPISVGGLALYGSAARPGSLKEIPPGKWIRVRAKARLYAIIATEAGRLEALLRSGGPVPVRASFLTLRSSFDASNATEVSTPALPFVTSKAVTASLPQ